MTRIAGKLKNEGIALRENVLASTLTTFGIGGRCDALALPACAEELARTVCICRANGVPYYPIGNGSNLLVADDGVRGVLISTRGLSGIRRNGAEYTVLCGTPLQQLLYRSFADGYADLLFAVGIPATLGGAIRMNAGTGEKGLLDVVKSVSYLDPPSGKIRTIFAKECDKSYRKSIFQSKNWVILSAVLSFSEQEAPEVILAKAGALLAKRKATQPIELPSAGSVFCRVFDTLPLSRLFDEWGLKGMRIGGAEVSQKHAGFIVNRGDARAADVMTLIKKMQDIAERRIGVRPRREICLIPDADEFFFNGEK